MFHQYGQRVRISYRDNVLRLPDNSPFWQHFTQEALLCTTVLYTIFPEL